jgi:integrase
MPKVSTRVLATDREVQFARAHSRRTEFRIKGARNLVLRVSESGCKTWVFLYASPASGQRKKITIGTYPAWRLARARHEALSMAVAVHGGTDPLAARISQSGAESFESLARAYMTEHERRNARGERRSASTQEAWRLLNTDILPKIGSYKAEGITKRDVIDTVECAAQRGAYVVADRILGLIRAIYNWALGTGRLDVNPTAGLKKRNTSRPRERVLSEKEIRKLWRALEMRSGLSCEIRDALKLQLLLGLRRSEVLSARVCEIDLERGVWVIPAIRTKARRVHCLPLPAMAVRILRDAIARAGGNPWLFPSPVSEGPVRAKSASRALLRVRGSINIDDVSTHDLRRTVATGLGNMGVSDEVIERLLNHAPRTVSVRHYNHAKHFERLQVALENWANHVQRIVERHPVATISSPIHVQRGAA